MTKWWLVDQPGIKFKDVGTFLKCKVRTGYSCMSRIHGVKGCLKTPLEPPYHTQNPCHIL